MLFPLCVQVGGPCSGETAQESEAVQELDDDDDADDAADADDADDADADVYDDVDASDLPIFLSYRIVSISLSDLSDLLEWVLVCVCVCVCVATIDLEKRYLSTVRQLALNYKLECLVRFNFAVGCLIDDAS